MNNPESVVDPVALKPRNEYNNQSKSVLEYAYAEDCNIEHRQTMEDGNNIDTKYKIAKITFPRTIFLKMEVVGYLGF